ncbi:MAG: hypothetical protein K1X28_07055 [Parachlamydiales bacterium]|nr:hypothetical protein [Parachlamydiales bacterium]
MFKKALIVLIAVCPILNGRVTVAEAKAAYFYPTNHVFRQIYSGGGIYGLELTWDLWRCLYGWSSASFFTKKGKAIGSSAAVSDFPTKIYFVPLAAGVKYVANVACWADIYAGIGIETTFLHIKDRVLDETFIVRKWGLGGIAKVGAYFRLYESLLLDIFADYSYMKIPYHNTHGGTTVPHNADISGFSFGGGIGYKF